MFIETRYFDDGRAQARMHEAEPKIEKSNTHDSYVEEYENLEEFVSEMEIELDDIVPLVLSLNNGGWVDITNYI